jgi:hypothetical protein
MPEIEPSPTNAELLATLEQIKILLERLAKLIEAIALSLGINPKNPMK